MSELRKDPIVGRWVIIAPDRAKRPEDFKSEFKSVDGGYCPFCEGNEDATPSEILAYREAGSKPNSKDWRIRVVPNKFPALKVEGDLKKRARELVEDIRAHPPRE